jgi:hypothetical protein
LNGQRLIEMLGLTPKRLFNYKVTPGVDGMGDLTPQQLLGAISTYSSIGIPRPQRYEDFVRKYGTVVWVYRAVSINARMLASIEFKTYRASQDQPDELVEAPLSPMAKLLKKVNPYMTLYDL